MNNLLLQEGRRMSVKLKSFFLFLLTLITYSSAFALNQPTMLPIQKWTTTSGTPVYYVHAPELPMIDIQVVFDAGSARDSNKPGLAELTNDSLNSGTQTRNADEIAMAFDNVGAVYTSAVNRDMAIVALRSLADAKFFQPAFHSFLDVISKPIFPMHEFTRIQKQILNLLNQEEQLPAMIATKAFYTAVYNNTPYGHPIMGTIPSVSTLKTNDLEDFYKKYYTANNALIAIVGSLNSSEAHNIAERLSSSLSKGPSLSPVPSDSVSQQALQRHISFPSAQTNILMGQIGIKRNDPSYFPATVGNYILGGGLLTSRLFEEVREKRGLAYSVRSQFSSLRERGPFIIELQTRNTEAANAINIVNNTLAKFIAKGPTAEEVISAKKNLTQGFILRLASNSAVIAQLVNIGFYKLPLSYLDTYKANISKVTNQDIKDVFQKIVNPEHLVTVTVGNTNTK